MSGQMYQDDTLPHQIRIGLAPGGRLAVSCNCMRTGQGYEPLEVREQWEAHEAQAVYRAHLARTEAAAS
jgi:hypothetical protein